MKPATFAIGVFVGIAALAAIYEWRSTRSDRSPMTAEQQSSAVRHPDTFAGGGILSASVPTGSRPLPINYKMLLAESRNYWEYAHSILPAAKAGNPDAQFYLSRTLERCEQDNNMYF